MIPEHYYGYPYLVLPDQISSLSEAQVVVGLQTAASSRRGDKDGCLNENIQSIMARRNKESFGENQPCQHNKTSMALPDDFCPTPYTVIIGKGKIIKENLGNKRLRILASNFLAKYSKSTEKRAKTLVVNEIIDSIESAGGTFVKKDRDGRWYKATDQAVREKIGYVFRDFLCDKYRSSSKAKVAKRHQEQLRRASVTLERAMRRTLCSTSGIPTFIFPCASATETTDAGPLSTGRKWSNVPHQASEQRFESTSKPELISCIQSETDIASNVQ